MCPASAPGRIPTPSNRCASTDEGAHAETRIAAQMRRASGFTSGRSFGRWGVEVGNGSVVRAQWLCFLPVAAVDRVRVEVGVVGADKVALTVGVPLIVVAFGVHLLARVRVVERVALVDLVDEGIVLAVA